MCFLPSHRRHCAQVLEGWLQWAAMGALKQDAIRQAIISMVDKLAVALHAAGKVGSQCAFFLGLVGCTNRRLSFYGRQHINALCSFTQQPTARPACLCHP